MPAVANALASAGKKKARAATMPAALNPPHVTRVWPRPSGTQPVGRGGGREGGAGQVEAFPPGVVGADGQAAHPQPVQGSASSVNAVALTASGGGGLVTNVSTAPPAGEAGWVELLLFAAQVLNHPPAPPDTGPPVRAASAGRPPRRTPRHASCKPAAALGASHTVAAAVPAPVVPLPGGWSSGALTFQDRAWSGPHTTPHHRWRSPASHAGQAPMYEDASARRALSQATWAASQQARPGAAGSADTRPGQVDARMEAASGSRGDAGTLAAHGIGDPFASTPHVPRAAQVPGVRVEVAQGVSGGGAGGGGGGGAGGAGVGGSSLTPVAHAARLMQARRATYGR